MKKFEVESCEEEDYELSEEKECELKQAAKMVAKSAVDEVRLSVREKYNRIINHLKDSHDGSAWQDGRDDDDVEEDEEDEVGVEDEVDEDVNKNVQTTEEDEMEEDEMEEDESKMKKDKKSFKKIMNDLENNESKGIEIVSKENKTKMKNKEEKDMIGKKRKDEMKNDEQKEEEVRKKRKVEYNMIDHDKQQKKSKKKVEEKKKVEKDTKEKKMKENNKMIVNGKNSLSMEKKMSILENINGLAIKLGVCQKNTAVSKTNMESIEHIVNAYVELMHNENGGEISETIWKLMTDCIDFASSNGEFTSEKHHWMNLNDDNFRKTRKLFNEMLSHKIDALQAEIEK